MEVMLGGIAFGAEYGAKPIASVADASPLVS